MTIFNLMASKLKDDYNEESLTSVAVLKMRSKLNRPI